MLFNSDRDHNFEIYRMLPDGRAAERGCTNTADGHKGAAAGLPDGRWIAYERWADESPAHLWLMSRDGPWRGGPDPRPL